MTTGSFSLTDLTQDGYMVAINMKDELVKQRANRLNAILKELGRGSKIKIKIDFEQLDSIMSELFAYSKERFPQLGSNELDKKGGHKGIDAARDHFLKDASGKNEDISALALAEIICGVRGISLNRGEVMKFTLGVFAASLKEVKDDLDTIKINGIVKIYDLLIAQSKKPAVLVKNSHSIECQVYYIFRDVATQLKSYKCAKSNKGGAEFARVFNDTSNLIFLNLQNFDNLARAQSFYSPLFFGSNSITINDLQEGREGFVRFTNHVKNKYRIEGDLESKTDLLGAMLECAYAFSPMKSSQLD